LFSFLGWYLFGWVFVCGLLVGFWVCIFIVCGGVFFVYFVFLRGVGVGVFGTAQVSLSSSSALSPSPGQKHAQPPLSPCSKPNCSTRERKTPETSGSAAQGECPASKSTLHRQNQQKST